MSTKSKKPHYKKQLDLLFLGLFIATVISFILSTLGSVYWIFDLFAHFQQYYLISFFVILIASILLKKRVLTILSILFSSIVILQFLPFYQNVHKSNESEQTRSVLMANVLGSNTEYYKLIDVIKTTKPDIIILAEITNEWVEALQVLEKDYPYSAMKPQNDNFGVILMSSVELTDAYIETFVLEDRPTVIAKTMLGNKEITIMGTHPEPPFSNKGSKQRNLQLHRIAEFISENKNPTLLVGDLNVTPFSVYFKRLVNKGNLHNCFNGFGYQPSWQFNWLLPPLKLAIDNCLHTDGIVIKHITTLPNIGSDHVPLFITIQVSE